MSKCKSCGQENDVNSTFCESCGAKLNTATLSGRSRPEEPIKEEGMAQSTKILIIIGVILVIGVGIAAGVLIKNSQQPPSSNVQNTTNVSTNVSTNQISTASGFPVSDVPNLAFEITKNNGKIASVIYNSITLDKNQCLYILAKAIVMINNGQQGNIPIKSYGNAANPYGTVTGATIAKADYINMASRTYTWMDNNGNAPNFVGITNPGQPDLSPDTTLNLFANILSQYKSTGQLPPSVTIT